MGVHDALWPALLNEVRQLAPHALIPWLVKSVKESDCKRSRPHDVEHVSAIHKEPVPLRDLPKKRPCQVAFGDCRADHCCQGHVVNGEARGEIEEWASAIIDYGVVSHRMTCSHDEL